MLLTGSGDEFCGLLLALFQGVAYLLPAVGLPAFPAVCLLRIHVEISSLLLCPSLVCFQHFHPLCCVLVFGSLFIVQFVFFLCGEVSLSRGLCWFILGVAVGILHDAWHSSVWSPKCFWSRCGAGSWWQQQPSCFLSVTWCGETFYWLGVQGVEILILLGALFLPSVAPVSQQGFWFTELMLSASLP
jgi:hypothetical protein